MDDTTSTAVADAPASSTPSEASSAGAPVSSEAVSPEPSRPTSFKDALTKTTDRLAQGIAAPDPTDPAARVDVAAKKGPIPFDNHERILANTRQKTAAERDADWETRVGWAKDLNRTEVSQLVAFRQALAADPVATLASEFRVLASHPTFGPQLRSLLGRELAAAPRQAAEAPLPVLQLENGQVVDLNQLRESIRQQTLQDASKQFQPAMDAAKELQQAKEHAVAQQQATSFATGFMGSLKALPLFKEHAKEIQARLATTKLETDHPAEVRAATLAIYNDIVLPKLSQAGSAQLMASLKQKAVAQTETPSRGASAPLKRPTNKAELAAYLRQKSAERG